MGGFGWNGLAGAAGGFGANGDALPEKILLGELLDIGTGLGAWTGSRTGDAGFGAKGLG